MTILVWDTETTDTPKKVGLTHETQPWLVELAAVLFEDDGTERASFNLIVKPDGWVVPEFAAGIHGITTEIAERSGVPLIVALSALTHLWSQADMMVAHNAEFDSKIIDIAIARTGREPACRRPPSRCTMRLATPVLKLPPTEKMIAKGMTKHYKRPSLQEAHTGLLGMPFEGAHRAIDDARACGRVWFELVKRGVV